MGLLSESYFALFLIIALGFILGKIKIRGISLDVSAVIFIALLFGHFGVIIPKDFQYIGLLLFIFTIAIQAGPGFMQSFKKQGIPLFVRSSFLIISALLVSLGLSRLFHIDLLIGLGLFTGALTSTPGLAVLIDTTSSPLASIAYGVAYPIGVLGVILFVRIFPLLFKVDVQKAEEEIQEEVKADNPEINHQHFVVENSNICGKSIQELQVRSMTRACWRRSA